jgi:hypothetical protein
MLEKLADKGTASTGTSTPEKEARKLFVEQVSARLSRSRRT